MSNENGAVWIEEYYDNPSICVLCFMGPDGKETKVGLTRSGVETTIEMLINWAEYADERMESLFENLESLGGAE